MSVHQLIGEPSPWVVRHAGAFPRAAEVLDLACGGGRHALWLAARGMQVEAVDRDVAALRTLTGVPGVRTRVLDLEGDEWPYGIHEFDVVLVTNYLFRPRLEQLFDCVRPDGFLIYETFMVGNERFGKPSNPDFLLQPGELLARAGEDFTVLAFEQGEVTRPKPAMVQRIFARRGRDLFAVLS